VVNVIAYPGKGGEVMKEDGKDVSILQKDKNYVKFHRLLAKAEAEGRLDGKFQCPVCGMRFLSSREADDCCRIISD
jgi:hypothetical protein